MIPWPVQLLACLGFLLASAPAAPAFQLDLPKTPAKAPKDPADVLRPLTPAKGDVAPKPKDGAAPLDLPAGAAPPAAAPERPATGTPEDAARALFRELAVVRDVQHVSTVFEGLLALGPSVVPVARAALAGNHAPTVLVAGRLCLIGGTSEDRAAVAERLRSALPAEAAAPLLAELVARDPVLCTPEYLVGLLDHPSSSMRTAALTELEARAGKIPLNAIAPLFASSRVPTRSAALELVGRSDDPLAWNLLASRLGDPSAQMARRAADLLAAIDGAEGLVLERAFPPEIRPGPLAWDRARAYALLAVVQREESTQRTLLGEPRIGSLLDGLHSSLPLVSGACAIGLARVGFRVGPSRAGTWLDREVPHALVRSGTGAEFHNDFSSLERPALRALTLLTGESFGADGDAWRRWWLDNANSFRARHAVIELGSDAASQLLVSFRDEHGNAWCLLGPARAVPAGQAAVLRMDASAAERLRARLEAEGVFGAERLPTGVRSSAEIALRVAVGDQEKCFLRAASPGAETWPEALLVELRQVAGENAWQLYYDPGKTSAAEWWSSQHERFAGLAPVERARALVPLVIEAARRATGSQRDADVSELERLYADAAVPAAADYEPLLALLAGEQSFGPRAEKLCELVRVAAGLAAGASEDSHARERLIELGLGRFGPEADAVLARVARDLEPDVLRTLARDPRPRARALGAQGLARGDGSEADRALLGAMLGDTDPSVQLALLAGLEGVSEERAGDLRPALLERARSGSSAVRAATLRVLAHWGGKDVQDLALEAVGDPDAAVQLAGVEALAQLADPRSASLMASLLARGPESPLYTPARRGLRRMGQAGIDECVRLAGSSAMRPRREGALLLSEALVPEAAGILLGLLAENPADERVAWELSVLAGIDLVAEARPDQAAQAWWDLVVHDDSLAWLLSAAERAGVPTPPRSVLEGPLGAEGGRFLLTLADLPSEPLAERAIRELERRLALELARPSSAAERGPFLKELHEAVRARLGD